MPLPAARFQSKSLVLALACSAALHALVLAFPLAGPAKARPEVLEVRLTPAEMAAPVKPAEDLLKDTLAKGEKEKRQSSPSSGKTGERGGKPRKIREAAAQRKLAQHVYYPEEAIRQGLEGEVRLLVTLDASGRVLTVEVAAGSGHAILDEAARSAALAMGSLPEAGVREIILPVVFRLH